MAGTSNIRIRVASSSTDGQVQTEHPEDAIVLEDERAEHGHHNGRGPGISPLVLEIAAVAS